MGNDSERAAEVKKEKHLISGARLLEGGLQAVFATHGIEVTGLSFKTGPYETLLVIKGVNGGGAQVCFVGARDCLSCLHKARSLVGGSGLTWKDDKWANA